MSVVRHVSCTETAKLVRAALKKAFPRVKFSVRSHTYAGGASITVRWTDGPTAAMVEQVVGVYGGGGFDGMIDMAYCKYAWLQPDGSATFAKTFGTANSRGTVDSDQTMQPSFKSELVRFGADSVSCVREVSEGLYRRALETVCRRFGEDPATFTVVPSTLGNPYVNAATDRDVGGFGNVSELVRRELRRRVVAI